MKNPIKWLYELLDYVEEEYRLNVIACHPHDGPPPITLEEYKAMRKV